MSGSVVQHNVLVDVVVASVLVLQAWVRWEQEGVIAPSALEAMSKARAMGPGSRAAVAEVVARYVPENITYSTRIAHAQNPEWEGYLQARTESKWKQQQAEGCSKTEMLATLGPTLLEEGLRNGDVTTKVEPGGKTFYYMEKRSSEPMHAAIFMSVMKRA